jgi:hypothetical protein
MASRGEHGPPRRRVAPGPPTAGPVCGTASSFRVPCAVNAGHLPAERQVQPRRLRRQVGWWGRHDVVEQLRASRERRPRTVGQAPRRPRALSASATARRVWEPARGWTCPGSRLAVARSGSSIVEDEQLSRIRGPGPGSAVPPSSPRVLRASIVLPLRTRVPSPVPEDDRAGGAPTRDRRHFHRSESGRRPVVATRVVVHVPVGCQHRLSQRTAVEQGYRTVGAPGRSATVVPTKPTSSRSSCASCDQSLKSTGRRHGVRQRPPPGSDV